MAKKLKMKVPPVRMKTGNIHERRADHTQCVMLPNTCPLERTLFGKTSEINTQMTAPSEMAKKAINPIRQISI